MTELKPIIATWRADTAQDQAHFPQVSGDIASADFQAVYWRCVACFFATLARVGSPARRVLFTSAERLPVVDGIDLNHLLDELGVEVIRLPLRHRLTHPSIKSWGNQFYLLDIIREAQRCLSFESLVVLDCDCVWTRPTDALFADLNRFGVLTLQLSHPEQEVINGISRRDMKRAAELFLGKPLSHVPHYVGGEIFACRQDLMARVQQLADGLWKMLSNPSADPPLLREEAHLLSLVYDLMDIPPGTADAHIKRMWTTFHFHNVTQDDIESSRCLWHLPAEKQSGFVSLFGEVVRPQSRFWSIPQEELPRYLAGMMGLPRRDLTKWKRDLAAKLREKAAAALSKLVFR
jgi:hypothetical protein